LILIESMI